MSASVSFPLLPMWSEELMNVTFCLFCLGEGHNVSICKARQHFTPKAEGDRASKLKPMFLGEAFNVTKPLFKLALEKAPMSSD